MEGVHRGGGGRGGGRGQGGGRDKDRPPIVDGTKKPKPESQTGQPKTRKNENPSYVGQQRKVWEQPTHQGTGNPGSGVTGHQQYATAPPLQYPGSAQSTPYPPQQQQPAMNYPQHDQHRPFVPGHQMHYQPQQPILPMPEPHGTGTHYGYPPAQTQGQCVPVPSTQPSASGYQAVYPPDLGAHGGHHSPSGTPQPETSAAQAKLSHHCQTLENKAHMIDERLKTAKDILKNIGEVSNEGDVENHLLQIDSIQADCNAIATDLSELERLKDTIFQMLSVEGSKHDLTVKLESRLSALYEEFVRIQQSLTERDQLLKQQSRFLEFQQECIQFQNDVTRMSIQKDKAGEWAHNIEFKAQEILQENTGFAENINLLVRQVSDSYKQFSDRQKETSTGPHKTKETHFHTEEREIQAPMKQQQHGAEQLFKQFEQQAEVLLQWVQRALQHTRCDDMGKDVHSTQTMLTHTEQIRKFTREKEEKEYKQVIATAEEINKVMIDDANSGSKGGQGSQPLVNRVKALEEYRGQTFTIPKGEIMELVDTQRLQFWNVKIADGRKVLVEKSFLEPVPIHHSTGQESTLDQYFREDLTKVAQRLRELKQKLENLAESTLGKLTKLQDKQKHHAFLQKCTELDQLLDKNLGLRSRGDVHVLRLKIDELAEDCEGTQYETEVKQRQEELELRCKEANAAIKRNADLEAEAVCSAGTDDGMSSTEKDHSEGACFRTAWGSVSVYVVYKDQRYIAKTYDISKDVDACKVQYVLEKGTQTVKSGDVKLTVSIDNSIIQCEVGGAGPQLVQDFKPTLLKVFECVLKGFEVMYVENDADKTDALHVVPADQIKLCQRQNRVEIYDCGARGLCVVGSETGIEKFWKDIGISDGQPKTTDGKAVEGTNQEKHNVDAPDAQAPSQDEEQNVEDGAARDLKTGHAHLEPDKQSFGERSGKTGKTSHKNIDQSETEKQESSSTENADFKSSPVLGRHQEQMSDPLTQEKRPPLSESQLGHSQPKLAWDRSMIGWVPEGESHPQWLNVTKQVDPRKLQFALTNESPCYKDLYLKKMDKQGINTTILEHGILCSVNDQIICSQDVDQNKSILKIFQSEVENKIKMKILKRGSDEHQVLMKETLIGIETNDVAMYQSKTDEFVYLVGDIDELDSVAKDLQGKVDHCSSACPKAPNKGQVCKDGWITTTFMVKCGSEMKEIQAPLSIDLALLQFALTCQEDHVHTRFKKYGIDFRVGEGNDQARYFVDGSNCTNKPDIQHIVSIVKEVFTEVTSQLDKQYCDEGMARQVLAGLEKSVPEELDTKLVAVYVYNEDNTMCIVGRRGKVKKVLQNIGVTITGKTQCLICGYEAIQLLRDLKFLDFLQSERMDKFAMVETGNTIVKLEGEMDRVAKLETTIKTFLENVFRMRVTFNNPDCEKLLVNENGEINEKLVLYMQNAIKTKPVSGPQFRSIIFTFRAAPGEAVELVCRNKASYDKIASQIQQMIVPMVFAVTTDEIKGVIQKGCKSGKVKILSSKDNRVLEVVCSIDVHKELNSAIETNQTDINFPKLIMVFLQTHGQDIIASLGKEIGVEIELHADSLSVKGKSAQIKLFKQKLKEQIKERRRSVPVHDDSEMALDQSMIDEMMKSYGSGSLQHISQSDMALKNCSYLATWFSPIDSFKLSVVEGEQFKTEADVKVVLANDSLCPIEPIEMDVTNAMESGFELSQKVGRNFKLGEVHFSPPSKGSKRELAFLVAAIPQEGRVKPIDKMLLQNKISQILMQAREKKHQTVLIDSKGVTGMVDSETVIKAAVCGAQDYFINHPDGDRLELGLCCDKDAAQYVLGVTSKCFKRNHRYGRRVYPNCTDTLKENKGNTVKVKVDLKSIFDVKADVLVNSASRMLDLSSGYVSKELLKLAGWDAQEILRKEYPHGISYGNVAITKPFGLAARGTKYIFHAALPNYDISPLTNWKHGVKQFVKACLYNANTLRAETIVFPALGVGSLGYPWRDSALAMFDAIQEFQEEIINLNLKTVKIALHAGDRATCYVFSDEEWRRSKKFQKEVAQIAEPISGYSVITLPSKKKPTVHVGQQEDIRRASNALEIFLVLTWQPSSGSKLKRATEDPKSLHDSVTVFLANNKQDTFARTIHECFEIGQEERATEMIIYTCTSNSLQISHGDQVRIIADTLGRRKSSTQKGSAAADKPYLKTLFIAVPDTSALQNVADKCLNDPQNKWEKARYQDEENVKITVELVGKTPEQASKAEDQVKQWLKKSAATKAPPRPEKLPNKRPQVVPSGTDSKGAKPKATNTAYELAAAQGNTTVTHAGNALQETKPQPTSDPFNIGDSQYSKMPGSDPGTATSDTEDGVIDYDQVFGDISAIINPGIISHKKQSNDLRSWLGELERCFGVTVSIRDGNVIQVKGSLSSVSGLQEYLDVDFPADPLKKVESSSKAASDKGDKVAPSTVPPKKFADSKMEETTPERDTLKANTSSHGASSNIQFDDKMVTEFKLGNISVKLFVGDLKSLKVDAIGISNQSRLLNRYGLAKHIASYAGPDYQEECERAGRNELKLSECRTTGGGNLNKAVVHIYSPTKVSRTTLRESLNDLENAIANCFEEAIKMKMKSLALSCIGAGSSGFDTHLCAQQYVRALKWLGGKNTSLKTVVFADLNVECLKYLHGELKRVPAQLIRLVPSSEDQMVMAPDHQGSDVDAGVFLKQQAVAKAPSHVKYWQLNTNTNVKVFVIRADVTAVKAGAVVSPEDEQFSGAGRIARALKKLWGDQYKDPSKKRVGQRKVVESRCGQQGSLLCEYILHTIAPRWSKPYIKNAGTFEKDMNAVLKEVLEATNRHALDSLAIPLLGTKDKKDWKLDTPVETCCKAMINGIQNHYFEKNYTRCPKRIDICCNDDGVMSVFNSVLSNRGAWKSVR